MENFCKGVAFGLVTGMVAGAIIVAKNKKLASKIKQGLGIAEEKMQEAKEFIEEKVEEIKSECKESENMTFDDSKTNYSADCVNKDFNKKSKN